MKFYSTRFICVFFVVSQFILSEKFSSEFILKMIFLKSGNNDFRDFQSFLAFPEKIINSNESSECTEFSSLFCIKPNLNFFYISFFPHSVLTQLQFMWFVHDNIPLAGEQLVY